MTPQFPRKRSLNFPQLHRVKTLLLVGIACTSAAASAQGPAIPGTCENDWNSRSKGGTLTSDLELRALEKAAGQGALAAQYRLGLAKRTADGQWTAPKGFNTAWLEKASLAGSKTAGAQLAELRHNAQWDEKSPVEVTYGDYLNYQVAAARDEGDAWAATRLMQIAIASNRSTGACTASMRSREVCNPEVKLITRASTGSWAVIAGEGGNPHAQNLLCAWSSQGMPELGVPKNFQQAFRWCLVASHNACDVTSPRVLSSLYRDGLGTPADAEAAKWWLEVFNRRQLPGAATLFSQP